MTLSFLQSLSLRCRTFTMTRNLCKPRPAKVLIIGGGYGGLSTAVNLVNLGLGKPQLSGSVSVPELDRKPQTTPEITLIDERDGICKSCDKS